MCMYPQIVPAWTKSPYGKPVQNWPKVGLPSAKSNTEWVERPCGKCPDCRRLRAMQWSFRLTQESKNSYTGMFLTLTYDEEHVPYRQDDMTLKKSDPQLFLKNLKRQAQYIYEAKKQPNFNKYGKNRAKMEQAYLDQKGAKIKYFLIGEYGTKTERPHYHAIIFNVPRPLYSKIPSLWKKGNVVVGNVTPKSIRYVANYVMCTDANQAEKQKEYANMSKGIGLNYLEQNQSFHRKQLQATVRYNDHEIPMPKYYRDKTYIPEEKEIIGKINENKYLQRIEEQKQELAKKGMTIEQYLIEENRRKWRKFYEHRKTKI